MHRETTALTIIRSALKDFKPIGKAIPIDVDRWTLARLRWRTTASDGREFGFELDEPLQHGDVVSSNDYGYYVIEQSPEEVIVCAIQNYKSAATLAWSIGNLHQPIQITSTEIIAAADTALNPLFEQLQVHGTTEKRVFQPLRAAIGHHHHHQH